MLTLPALCLQKQLRADPELGPELQPSQGFMVTAFLPQACHARPCCGHRAAGPSWLSLVAPQDRLAPWEYPVPG